MYDEQRSFSKRNYRQDEQDDDQDDNQGDYYEQNDHNNYNEYDDFQPGEGNMQDEARYSNRPEIEPPPPMMQEQPKATGLMNNLFEKGAPGSFQPRFEGEQEGKHGKGPSSCAVGCMAGLVALVTGCFYSSYKKGQH